MRKLLLLAAAILPLFASAQLATFEALPLSGTDTFYINRNNSLLDSGFNDVGIHFPYVWDTSYGGSWGQGFSYSNVIDSVTSGYFNQYAAKPAKGYNGSDKYAVYWAGYGVPKSVSLVNKKSFTPQSLYFTNTTYAYNSMRSGDFVAKKFGGVSGNDTDWFKVTVHAYYNGIKKADSVNIYLADFRFANNTQDYIVNKWTLASLTALGTVDSIYFVMTSSDTGMYGINTPTYFAIDNFLANPASNGVTSASAAQVARVYPNPATSTLNVSLLDAGISQMSIYDMGGKLIARQQVSGTNASFNTANFSTGMYTLKLEGQSDAFYLRFIKQ